MRALARGPEPDADLLIEQVRSMVPSGMLAALDFGAPTAVVPIDAFLSHCDAMLSVETFYDPYLVESARQRGVERVLYANPELLNPADPCERADRYLYAAEWGLPYPAPGEILPWPTSPDLMVRKRPPRNPVPAFVHAAAEAMLDRNGTEVVLDACQHIEQACRIVVYGDRNGRTDWHNERVSLEWRDRVADYRDLYAEADCLLLPRRYGALSLPMLEAAAAGVPTITTDLSPQAEWFAEWPELLIPAGEPYHFSMKGSRMDLGQPGVPIATPSGEDLAAAIDKLASDSHRLRAMGAEVSEWAEVRSWPNMLGEWRTVLDL